MKSEDWNQAWATRWPALCMWTCPRPWQWQRGKTLASRETSRLVVGGYVDVQDCRGQHHAPVTHWQRTWVLEELVQRTSHVTRGGHDDARFTVSILTNVVAGQPSLEGNNKWHGERVAEGGGREGEEGPMFCEGKGAAEADKSA